MTREALEFVQRLVKSGTEVSRETWGQVLEHALNITPPDSFVPAQRPDPSPCCGARFDQVRHACGCVDGRCANCGDDTWPLVECVTHDWASVTQ